jgi:hypothetical protein
MLRWEDHVKAEVGEAKMPRSMAALRDRYEREKPIDTRGIDKDDVPTSKILRLYIYRL